MKWYFQSIFFLVISYVFFPLFYLGAFLRRMLFFDPSKPRILIVQSARIGDMVCITPLFREIKKAHSQSFIATLVADPATGVTTHNPYIDRFVSYDPDRPIVSAIRAWFLLKPLHFDYVLIPFPGAMGNALSVWLAAPFRATTTLDIASKTLKLLFPLANIRERYTKEESAPKHHLKFLRYFGIQNPSDQREVFRNSASDEKVLTMLQNLRVDTQKPIVAISTGCGKEFRKWPLERFCELVENILRAYPTAQIILTGGREDRVSNRELIKKINEKGRIFDTAEMLQIIDLPSFFSHVKLFISVSTGPLYIADAMGCATIDIIGTDNAINQAPQGNTIVVQNDTTPSCSYVMYPPTCSKETLKVRMDISVDVVIRAVEKLLQ